MITAPLDLPPEMHFHLQPEASCFVCGQDAHSRWFARMTLGGRAHSLCSAACALMYFAAEEAPAHDHRARHDFERARAAITQAAHRTTTDVNL